MSQCWKCTLETSVFGPISQSAVAKCLSCSNKCLFFSKLWAGKRSSLTWENLSTDTISKFQQAHHKLLKFYIFQIHFLSQAKERNSPPHLGPTMDSKVDSRLIKSVVFRPALQWRGLIEWRYVILGHKNRLTITLDPPWTLTHVHLEHLYFS